MRIKLAILEKDTNYLERIVSAFETRYTDKLEIYSFTQLDLAYRALEDKRIGMFVANEAFDIDMDRIPKRCGFAYFVDFGDVDFLNGKKAICKFQKVELIYKQILSIYSESVGNVSGIRLGERDTKIVVFSSPCGGVGTSSLAVACAKHYSSTGRKTLYLNLEKCGNSDLFFSAQGGFDMSDIVYTLKSKKANLSMKLESCIKQDQSGVYFYSAAKIVLDLLELSQEDVLKLVDELSLSGLYEYIIIDSDFGLDKNSLSLLKKGHAIVWVSDGKEIANDKIQRAYAALKVMERNEELPLVGRIALIYNKFSDKSGRSIGDIGLKSIGGAPVFLRADTTQVVDNLSSLAFYEKII